MQKQHSKFLNLSFLISSFRDFVLPAYQCFNVSDLHQRDPDTFKPLHVVSMTIRDSAEDSAAAAGDVLELCKMVNEPAEWLVELIIRCVYMKGSWGWREFFEGRPRVLLSEAIRPHGSLPARTMTGFLTATYRRVRKVLSEQEITQQRPKLQLRIFPARKCFDK